MWSTANVIDDLRNHRQVCAKVIIIENAMRSTAPMIISTLSKLSITYCIQRKALLKGGSKYFPPKNAFSFKLI